MAVALPDLRGIDLDSGDLGLLWKPGEGFRPIDGIDTYAPGKAPLCPVALSMKDMALDRVETLRACPAPVISAGAAHVVDWTAPPQPLWIATLPPTSAPPGLPPVTCCAHVPHDPPPVPHIPPVPLPATGLLIGLALAMLWGLRR